jgi:SAM-dependent methyltransferase
LFYRFISTKLSLSKESDRIIDLGCGNGMMLVDLAKAGYQNLIGVDYSQKAIDLARKVVNREGFPGVKLRVYNVVEPSENLKDWDFLFKLAHDKGTYDAISLHPHNSRDKRERYIRKVHEILCNGGFLILTSCNWTKDELIEHFKECKFYIFHSIMIIYIYKKIYVFKNINISAKKETSIYISI